MSNTETMTDEQKAAEAAAKAQAKADAAAKAQAEKQAKAAQKATEKAEREAKREADKKAKADAKIAAKQAAEDAKKAGQMPMQNDIRRPKANTECGKAWGIFDSISNANGSPAAIADAMVQTRAAGINDATTRTQYARWRKFHGVEGRIVAVTTKAPEPAQAA